MYKVVSFQCVECDISVYVCFLEPWVCGFVDPCKCIEVLEQVFICDLKVLFSLKGCVNLSHQMREPHNLVSFMA